jgi:hypothetical protein
MKTEDKEGGEVAKKKKPEWAKGVDWQEGFRLPRKRIRWTRIEFAPGIGIRYRLAPLDQTRPRHRHALTESTHTHTHTIAQGIGCGPRRRR